MRRLKCPETHSLTFYLGVMPLFSGSCLAPEMASESLSLSVSLCRGGFLASREGLEALEDGLIGKCGRSGE